MAWQLAYPRIKWSKRPKQAVMPFMSQHQKPHTITSAIVFRPQGPTLIHCGRGQHECVTQEMRIVGPPWRPAITQPRGRHLLIGGYIRCTACIWSQTAVSNISSESGQNPSSCPHRMQRRRSEPCFSSSLGEDLASKGRITSCQPQNLWQFEKLTLCGPVPST